MLLLTFNPGLALIGSRTTRPHLRTFARKFSNIDFFLRILPLKDDELVMSEMQKNGGSPTSFWR